MSGKTMSDWEKQVRAIGLSDYADSIHTNKTEDLQNLANSKLPQSNWISVPYTKFNKRNKELTSFLNKYIQLGEGFVVRLIPTPEGIKKDIQEDS